MSAARRLPLSRSALACALATVAALAGARQAAGAEEQMLRGPHPFLKENELSAHVLLAAGLGDAPSGTKVAFDYGFKLTAPIWLDLQLNLQHGSCQSTAVTECGPGTGDAFETLAGVKLKWPTPIPVVPYGKVGGGLVFVFPNGAKNAMGVVARVAGGANYFFYDWLGLGAEVGFSLGRVAYDPTFPGGPAYAVIDFGGGIELQF
jgi:hypothetical protein